MSIEVTIKNNEAAGSAAKLAVVLVTVGVDLATDEHKYVLAAQGEVTLQVQQGQFVTVDETDKEL